MAITDDDSTLLESLLDGDERAFATLIDRHHGEMLRLAKAFVDDEPAAEEVVQETWMAVIDGLDDFEGRGSLKTWIFSILTNLAKKRGKKDARTVPWSELSDEPLDGEVAEESNRFSAEGRWSAPPVPWNTDPEQEAMRAQQLEIVQETIDQLPASQQAVVTMRDVQGWPAEEVCEVLDITRGNQRVLLHRGRTSVREALESHLKDAEEGDP